MHRTRLALGEILAPAMVALFMAATPVAAKCDEPPCGQANGHDKGADPAATPELDSIVLFGTGLLGAAGYAMTRFRASRRHDEVTDSATA